MLPVGDDHYIDAQPLDLQIKDNDVVFSIETRNLIISFYMSAFIVM